jgi:hypothetical protein
VNEIPLPALEGTNPLGFLAALGALDALATTTPGVTLRWTDELVPQAVIGGVSDVDSLLDALDRDREQWTTSPLLQFPGDDLLTDAKPGEKRLREWFEFVSDHPRAAGHLSAIVAEWAFDNNQKAKPTHLHFTAGQQQFLSMIRELASGVDRDRIREAVCGPWRYDSPLPTLSWDARGERVYALRGGNPSKEKRLGVPGADWLAFRGLVFYPVTRREGGSLKTTACDVAWKSSAFRWPLWRVPASRDVVRSLVADGTLVSKPVSASRSANVSGKELEARGILSLRESPIRRTDQGGYGSFGASVTLASADDR